MTSQPKTDHAPDLPLASEFPKASREQWLTLVEGVLKGASFDKKLVSKTYDGLTIEPLYERKADAAALPGRAPATPWQVMMRVDHPDPKQANLQALDDLQNGANGLVLVCPGSVGAQGFGIDTSANGLARILDGIYLDAGAPIEFQLTRDAKDVPAHVAAIVRQRGLTPETCDLRIGFDPIGLMAAGSSAHAPWSDIAPLFARMTRTLADEGFRGPFAAADARLIHNAGGSEVEELAYALSTAVAYWRTLEASGLSHDTARRMIFFRLAADADQFMTMAKFRALRKLWSHVESAADLTPAPAFIAAETAWRMMTRRDPYVNMLRVTISAFAAGLGGANAVTVLPFTSALGLPDAFARRVARNTQLVLLEEANLAKVEDPAAGSGGIEALTDELCRAAWQLFQEIEKAGGITAALASGWLQNKVAETRKARMRAIATRKDPLTGTSAFPNLTEAQVNVLMPASSPPPESGSEQSDFIALPTIRLAGPYEKLRDASDAMLNDKGTRPKVFLAALGKPSDTVARLTFARSLFEAGGIEAVELSGDDLAADFKASGASIACLCSSDEVYAQEAASAAQALSAAGARAIYLASHPDGLADAGITHFIYAGCDVPATLQGIYDMIAEKSS